MKFLIALSFSLFAAMSSSSDELLLCIVDKQDGLPIAECVVYVNGIGIGVTDSKGCVVIPQTYRDSSVFIRHLAYEQLNIDLANISNGKVFVALKSNSYEIEAVRIATKKHRVKYRKMGITKTTARDNYVYSLWTKHALFIPNKDIKSRYIIQSIYIYISDKFGYPKAPFFVSLHRGERDYIAPNDSLRIFGPLLTQADGGGRYHRVNIYNDSITMPKEGLFVVLENCPTNKIEKRIKKIGEYTFTDSANYVCIGDTWDEVNKFYHWSYVHKLPRKGKRKSAPPIGFEKQEVQNKWVRDTIYWEDYPKRHAVHFGNPMIYVTLKELKK